MGADEYLEAIKALGLSQIAAGRLLQVSSRTAQNWAAGGVKGPAAVILRLLVKLPPESRKVALALMLDDGVAEN
jgi:DNA-binding transcriptional regulator YiaG